MSVTIRYHGSLGTLDRIEEMQEDFLDIAITNQWPSEIVDGAYSSLRREEAKGRAGLAAKASGVSTLSPPLTLKGIKLIVHPQTDPLWFTFDPEGALTRLGYYAVDHYGAKLGAQPTRRFEFVHQSQASIQTSVGGVELHQTVIRLLEYLKKRYVPDLQISDDSGYWENRDEANLRRLMDRR